MIEFVSNYKELESFENKKFELDDTGVYYEKQIEPATFFFRTINFLKIEEIITKIEKGRKGRRLTDAFNITEEAREELAKDVILEEVVSNLLRKIKDLLISSKKDYEIDLLIYHDPEFTDWNEFTMKIQIETDSENFKEILGWYKKIGNLENEVVTAMKQLWEEEASKIEDIDGNLAIIIEKL